MVSAPFSANFMLPVPEGFHASRRDLFGQIGGRNHDFRKRDVVVRNKHHFQKPAHGRIVVDDPGNIVGKFYDQLRVVITRRCLACEELNARYPIQFRVRTDLVVKRHRFDKVQKLALIFMDALDLDVEHGRGIDTDAHALRHRIGKPHLVQTLHFGKFFAETGIVGEAVERCQLSASSRKSSPIASRINPVRPGLHCISQRRGVMPLVLLLMRSG